MLSPPRGTSPRALLPPRARQVVDQPDHQRGPAGLVAGAEPASRLAVEVLVEEREVAVRGIVGEAPVVAVARAPALRVGQDEAREARRELVRDLLQREPLSRADRALDAQLVAEEVVVALERLDQQ